MASEIEEHFRLDFKADCFHSGSISFGKYESEAAALCWEKWSSFSHNRYLEEVQKCSTPGLVIEKKAYFEAHFKKKLQGVLGLTSPETSDNDNITPPQFDAIHDNAEMQQEFDSSNLDSQIEFLCDDHSVSEYGKVEKANPANLDTVISSQSIIDKLDGDTSDVSNLTIGMFDEKSDANCNGSSSKEKNSSQAEYTKRIVSQSRRFAVIDKHLGKKPSKTVNNKTSAKHKTPKHDQPGKKANGVKEIKRGEKELEVFQKLPNRVHRSENRIKAAVGASQENSRFRFKCNERAERRKEFDMKIEERMHAKKAEILHQLQAKTRGKSEAEIKQLREKLNFKATPLPSFYLRDSDRSKIKSSRTGCRASVSSRLSSKSSEQASGGTSCHSTVTSDSSPSSPAAEISNLKKEKHKVKIMSLPKHKMMDVKQKKRTVKAN